MIPISLLIRVSSMILLLSSLSHSVMVRTLGSIPMPSLLLRIQSLLVQCLLTPLLWEPLLKPILLGFQILAPLTMLLVLLRIFIRHFDGPDQIFIGNSQGLHIKGSSCSFFKSPLNSKFSFVLKNLLHVPSITKNLLSVSQFARDNSVYFEFHPYTFVVKSQATHGPLIQGTIGANGLHSFTHVNLHPSSALLSSSSSISPSSLSNKSLTSSPFVHTINSDSSIVPSTSSIWHTRLGHPNSYVLKLILNH